MQDFLGILLVVLITSASKAGGSAIELAVTSLVFATGVFVTVHQLSRFVEYWLISNKLGQTEITLYALGVGLIVATIANFLNISTALGAYFAGFALAETQAGNKIKKDVSFMRDFFLVFFFVGFGTTIFYNPTTTIQTLPSVENFILTTEIALALAMAIIFINFLVFSVFGAFFGLNKKDSSEAAILLTPLGEFVVIIATAAVSVVSINEKTLVPVLAFLLILITVFIFEPLYNLRNAHAKLGEKIPTLFSKPLLNSNIQAHTSYSIKQLQNLAWNCFVVLCLAWLTIILYNKLPVFGVPIPYLRQINSALIFAFFAIAPSVKALIALKNLLYNTNKKNLATV